MVVAGSMVAVGSTVVAGSMVAVGSTVVVGLTVVVVEAVRPSGRRIDHQAKHRARLSERGARVPRSG